MTSQYAPPRAETLCPEEVRDLASQVAHDVRSPLTAIASYAECLAWRTSADPLTRERYARSIVCETHRISRMLSDFAALVGYRRTDPLAECPLAEVLAAAADAVADPAALRGIAVSYVTEGPCPPLRWPALQLQQVVTAALEAVLTCARDHSSARLEAAPGPDQTLRIMVTAEPAEAFVALERSLSLRAAALLAAECGGRLVTLAGDEAGVELTLPMDATALPAMAAV